MNEMRNIGISLGRKGALKVANSIDARYDDIVKKWKANVKVSWGIVWGYRYLAIVFQSIYKLSGWWNFISYTIPLITQFAGWIAHALIFLYLNNSVNALKR